MCRPKALRTFDSDGESLECVIHIRRKKNCRLLASAAANEPAVLQRIAPDCCCDHPAQRQFEHSAPARPAELCRGGIVPGNLAHERQLSALADIPVDLCAKCKLAEQRVVEAIRQTADSNVLLPA